MLDGWIAETAPLVCLTGLGRRDALMTLRRDQAARAAMNASPQWTAAQRWAGHWADSDLAHDRAVLRGFAAQPDVQRGAITLGSAVRWALPPSSALLTYNDALQATRIHGEDLGSAPLAAEWITGWLRDLERHIVGAPATHAARELLWEVGVELLRWLGNHLSKIPQGVAGASDGALRSVRRAWSEIAPPGVSPVQTDSVRRLYLGSCANGHQSGRATGVVQWIARGRAIEQARRVPRVATSWAVAVDQADPEVACLSREALKRRQKVVRSRTLRCLQGPDLALRSPHHQLKPTGPVYALAA
jgi:hypothetical protein